ncbi:hypothetical protein HanIR_Chr01g0040991 [Helianthus annuus]|nr:hypothetical protein HanIR_Chr01g0040991 [Helianthus annuus]
MIYASIGMIKKKTVSSICELLMTAGKSTPKRQKGSQNPLNRSDTTHKLLSWE